MVFDGAQYYGLPGHGRQPSQASTSTVPYGANSVVASSSSAHHGQPARGSRGRERGRGNGNGRASIIQRPAMTSSHPRAILSSSSSTVNQAAFPNHQKYFTASDVVTDDAATSRRGPLQSQNPGPIPILTSSNLPVRMQHALPAKPIMTHYHDAGPPPPLPPPPLSSLPPQMNMPPSFQTLIPFQQSQSYNAVPYFAHGQHQQPSLQQPYGATTSYYHEQHQYSQQPVIYNQPPSSASFPSLAITPFAKQQLPPAKPQYTPLPPNQSAPVQIYHQSIPQPNMPFEHRPVHRTKCLICDIQYPSPIMLIAHQRNDHVSCCKAQELGCTFQALPHVVELHEQDRHLVFRPGAKRDAGGMDGPPNARIQGTTIRLETEEDIAKWIAERKRKWPSKTNIALREERDAKRKAYEAASPANIVDNNYSSQGRGRDRDRDRGRGRGREPAGRVRGRGRGGRGGRGDNERQDVGWPGATDIIIDGPVNQNIPPESESTTSRVDSRPAADSSDDGEDDEDDDEAVVATTLLRPAKKPRLAAVDNDGVHGDSLLSADNDIDSEGAPDEETVRNLAQDMQIEESSTDDDAVLDEGSIRETETARGQSAYIDKSERPCRTWISSGQCRFGKRCMYKHDPAARPKLVKEVPKNPFARDDLVGKLLYNEIKHEISDLRQVIDFLARNDWLKDVELYPGHKEQVENRIRVVKDSAELGKEAQTDASNAAEAL